MMTDLEAALYALIAAVVDERIAQKIGGDTEKLKAEVLRQFVALRKHGDDWQ